jgi:signal transduction histidine kinase/ActR/RegA family two-component response regulator
VTRSDFLELAGGIVEPLVLLENGTVAAANSAAEDAFGKETLVGAPLSELVAEPIDRVNGYLRMCSRSSMPIPGAITPLGSMRGIYICQGWRIAVRSPAPIVVLHLRPKLERVRSFTILNEKVEALTREIARRESAEAKLRESEAALAERVVEVERINRLKDDFLATISHELRTPINAIVNWVHLLRSSALDEARRESALETIARNARQQASLISDILDVSRIVSGKLRLDLRTVDLVAVIREAVETVRPAADAKRIEIQLTMDPAAGPIWGDAERLQQVMWNLLANAVKFVQKGGRIRVLLLRVNSHVEIQVEDNGPGIEVEFLPHVFEPFRQADSSMRRRHGGLGLGLAIVRNLVELHGGRVHAANRAAGRGAVFSITLPRQSLPLEQDVERLRLGTPAQETDLPLDAAPRLDGIRVLLIEDEPDSRDVMTEVLQICGGEVIAADSGKAALELLRRNPVDVIVSDIEMAEMDGYEFIAKLRSLPASEGGTIPAVALTAHASTRDRLRALRQGFQLHVGKPVQPAELVTVVASLARR